MKRTFWKMMLWRKILAYWVSRRLSRVGHFLLTASGKIGRWGTRGHTYCRQCGEWCHLSNVDHKGLCFACWSPPDGWENEE